MVEDNSKDQIIYSNSGISSGNTNKEEKLELNLKANGRCPWPFVFFHDPKTGMKDWQTWCVMGLSICWAWTRNRKQ